MATTTPNLQNLAVEWGVPNQQTIIADLVKSSGMLQTALVLPSSHGNQHKYKFFNALPTATFRNLGAGIVPSTLSKDRAKIDLWNLTSLMQEDFTEIEAHPGGIEGWFAQNAPAYLEGMGQAFSKQGFYGTTSFGSTDGFLGLHQYAKANSNVVSQAGGSSGSRTSIFCVRWDGSNGAQIRANAGSEGTLIKTYDITKGTPSLIVTDTTTNAQLPVYSWLLSAYASLVIPSKKSVSAITQLDSTHKPTVDTMNALVDAVESSSGNMVIYCNRTGRNYIASLKDTKLNMFKETMDYNNYLATWRGVPIVLDENIVSTETTDLD